jgi:hypothetical protein
VKRVVRFVVVIAALLNGCAETVPSADPPRLSWAVYSNPTCTSLPSGTSPVTVTTVQIPPPYRIDPSKPFQVLLTAESPSGIASIQLSADPRQLHCEARVNSVPGSESNSNFSGLSFPQLATKSANFNPVSTSGFVTMALQEMAPTDDSAVIRCSPNTVSIGTFARYPDAWSGMLTLTGTATDGQSPSKSSTQTIQLQLQELTKQQFSDQANTSTPPVCPGFN